MTLYEKLLVMQVLSTLRKQANKQKIGYGVWWHSHNLSAGEEEAKVFLLASQSRDSVMSRFSERLRLKKTSKMENRHGRSWKMLTSGL